MNKKVKVGLLALATAAVFASQGALAAVSAGDQIKFADAAGENATGGGSFLITDYDSTGSTVKGSFLSFCVEYNEHMSFGSFYKVAGISTEAKNGGVSGGNPDPLDVKTAWLYTNFIESPSALNSVGTWSTATAENKGTAMQLAIWKIEGEITSFTQFGSSVNTAASDLASALYTAAGSSGWTDVGRVKILNVTTLDGGLAQDQLYITPVPEPEIYAMMAAGLGLMGFVARRRKQSGM